MVDLEAFRGFSLIFSNLYQCIVDTDNVAGIVLKSVYFASTAWG